MRVTTSLLADMATVADGKLYIHGAGWDKITNPSVPLTHANIALVLMIELDPSEAEEQSVSVEIKLLDEDATTLVSVTGRTGDLSSLASGGPVKLPIAANFPGLRFPRAGSYTFIASANGAEIASVSLSVATE